MKPNQPPIALKIRYFKIKKKTSGRPTENRPTYLMSAPFIITRIQSLSRDQKENDIEWGKSILYKCRRRNSDTLPILPVIRI